MNQKFNYYRQLEDVELYLCSPDRRELFPIFATDRQVALRFNDLSEITFNVPATVSLSNGEKIDEVEYYDYIETHRTIKAKDIGWFKIKSVNEIDNGTSKYKAVEAESLQTMFKNKGIVIPAGTYKFYDHADPYDVAYEEYVSSGNVDGITPTPSVIGQLARQLGINLDTKYGDREARTPYEDWTVTYISDVLWSSFEPALYRTFEDTATNAYDWMVNDVAKAFNVVILFDFANLAIKIKTAEETTRRSNLCFSFSNFMNQIQITEDASEIVTVLNCTGNGVDITQVNPTGTNYIVDFSYYMDEVNHRWMSPELIAKLKEWEQVVKENKEEYIELIGSLREKYIDKGNLEERLTHVQTSLLDLRNARDERIAAESKGEELTGLIVAETVGITDRAEITGQKAGYEVAHSDTDLSAFYWGNPGFASNTIVTCHTAPPNYDNRTKLFSFSGSGRRSSVTDNLNTQNASEQKSYVYFIDNNDRSSYCKLTSAVKVNIDNQEPKQTPFTFADYNVATGEEFTIEYHGSSPSVEVPSFLSYYDDGGVVVFSAHAPGAGTIHLTRGGVQVGTYTVSATGSAISSPEHYDYKINIGGSFSIPYERNAPEVGCPSVLEYYDDGGELAFTAVKAGTGEIILRNDADGSIIAIYTILVEEKKTVDIIRPSANTRYYCDGFERYIPYADIGVWIEKKEKTEAQLSASIRTVENEIKEILDALNAITERCNLVSFMARTPKLLRELNCYWIEGDFSNENIIAHENSTREELIDLANSLLASGEAELAKVCQPHFSFELDASNAIRQYEFKAQCDELELGRIITVEKSEGVWYTPILLEMAFGLDKGSKEFVLKFGNKFRLDDWGYTYADLIAESASVSHQVKANWQNFMNYSKDKDAIQNMLKNPLDATLRTGLANAANQDFIVDDTGILGRKKTSAGDGTFENEQLRMINNLLLFTDDSWETIKTALGKVIYEENGSTKTAYGLLAEVIVGSLIMGNRMNITNSDNSIIIDGDGITIKDKEGRIVFQVTTDGKLTLTNYLQSEEASNAMKRFFESEFADDLEEIQSQIDRKAETWYQYDDPSVGWDESERVLHTGDLWCKVSDNSTYCWDGEEWVSQSVPRDVFDKIDKKAQIFVRKPEPPYSLRDLWAQGKDGGGAILICIKAKAAGETFDSSDWAPASDYTNDDAVDDVKNNIYYPGTTKINGGNIETGTVTADALRADALMSKFYKGSPHSRYSEEGSYFNLGNGAFTSKNFAITDGGNVHMRGTIHALGGQIGGLEIDEETGAMTYPKGTSFSGDDENGVYIGVDGIRYGNALSVNPNPNAPYLRTKRGIFDGYSIGERVIKTMKHNGVSSTLFDVDNDAGFLTAETIPQRIHSLEEKVALLRGETIGDFTYYADIKVGEYVTIGYSGTPPTIMSYPKCLGAPVYESTQVKFEGITDGTGVISVSSGESGVLTTYNVRVQAVKHTGTYTMYVGDTIEIRGFIGNATAFTAPAFVACTNERTSIRARGLAVGRGIVYVYIQSTLIGEYVVNVCERPIGYDVEVGQSFDINNDTAIELGDITVDCEEPLGISGLFDVTVDSGHVTLVGRQPGDYIIILSHDYTEIARYAVRVSEVVSTAKRLKIGESFTVSYAGLNSTSVTCPSCMSYVDDTDDKSVTFTALSSASNAVAKVRTATRTVSKYIVTIDCNHPNKYAIEGSRIESTCEVQGSVTYYCPDCGESPVDKLPLANHTAGAPVIVREATCKVCAEYAVRCTMCNKEIDRYENDGEFAEHIADGGRITKYATCETTGAYTYYCRECDKWLKEDTIAALGHAWGEPYYSDEFSSGYGQKCATCGELNELAYIECDHPKSACHESVITNPTCTAPGSKTFSCDVCRQSWTESIPASGHAYQGRVTKSATCSEEGVYTYTCSQCNDSYTLPLDMIECDFQYVQTVQPTCTSKGYDIYKCAMCGAASNRNYINATGHSYTSKVTASTCTAKGYTTHTCSKCNHSYTDNETAALGHNGGTPVRVREATCTVPAQYAVSCTRCNAEIDRYENEDEFAEHTLNEGFVTTNPTCVATGIRKYSCSKCGTWIKDEIVAATGTHTYSSKVTAPTCTEGGYTTHTCTVCGHSYTDNETDPNGHFWGVGGGWVTVTPATCVDKGKEKHTCNTCGLVDTRDIPAAGHNYEYDHTEDATCESGGYDVYTCTRCGDWYTTNETEENGHDFSDGWVTEKEATCEKTGTERRTCKTCGYWEDRDIPLADHDYEAIEDSSQSSGYIGVCRVCGDVREDHTP